MLYKQTHLASHPLHMPLRPPITTDGRFFPPQSALYRRNDGNLYPRIVPNITLLSHDPAAPEDLCIRTAPLANLQHDAWFRSIRARVWLEEDADALPADLHVACACRAEIDARMQNDPVAGGASLQDLAEGTVLYALRHRGAEWRRVRVAWAELRPDGLTAWCALEAVA
jgi:hypothetical protein